MCGGEVKPKKTSKGGACLFSKMIQHDTMQSRTEQKQTYQVFRVWPVPVSCAEAHLFCLAHLSTQLTTAWVCCTHLEQLMTSEGSQCYLIQSSRGNKEKLASSTKSKLHNFKILKELWSKQIHLNKTENQKSY